MNIILGIFMLLIALVFLANGLNSLLGRYGTTNKLWNIILAFSITGVAAVGGIIAFITNALVACGMLLLILTVWSGLALVGALIGRYSYSGPEIPGVDTGLNKWVLVFMLLLCIGSFLGAIRLI